jgi:hypothetical protein
MKSDDLIRPPVLYKIFASTRTTDREKRAPSCTIGLGSYQSTGRPRPADHEIRGPNQPIISMENIYLQLIVKSEVPNFSCV